MFEVRTGYWKYGDSVCCVTDDLMFARSFLLDKIRSASGMTPSEYARFDEEFRKFVSRANDYVVYGGKRVRASMYFSIRDYHYQIGETSIRVAVGGLSTLAGPAAATVSPADAGVEPEAVLDHAGSLA